MSGSIALLANLVHKGGDALTADPARNRILVRNERGERRSGYAVVAAIFV